MLKFFIFVIFISLINFSICSFKNEPSDEELDKIFKLKNMLLLESKSADKSGKILEQLNYNENWLLSSPDELFLNWVQFYPELSLEELSAKIKNTLEWRRKYKIENLSEWEIPKSMQQYINHTFTGFTSEGYPVIFLPIGNWNIRGAIREGHRENILKSTFKLIEESMKNANERDQKNELGIAKMYVITDWRKFSFLQSGSVRSASILSAGANLLQSHYPNSAVTVYMLNTPAFFNQVINLLKGVLENKSLDLLKVYGQNEEEWKNDILNELPSAVIPKSLGGDFVDA